MRFKKCLKVDFYALGQEHFVFMDPQEKTMGQLLEELNKLVAQIYTTAKVVQIESVQVSSREFKDNNISKIHDWISQVSIYNKD